MALFWLLSGAVHAKLNDITLCSDVFAFDGRAYFCAEHADLGKELFRTNGTNEDTFVVKDLDVGPGSSSPGGLFELNGVLYFIAETTPTGTALWRTDGSDSGTRLVTSLGLDGDDLELDTLRIVNMLEVEDELFIQLADNVQFSAGNTVLMRTDGTASGTLITDALVHFASNNNLTPSVPTSYIYSNGALYFLTFNTLYKMDISSNSISMVTTLPSETNDGHHAVIVEDSLSQGYFLIENFSLLGNADFLFRSDGTASGTMKIDAEVRNAGYTNAGYLYCDLDDGNLYVRQADDISTTLVFDNFESDCDFSAIRKKISAGILIQRRAQRTSSFSNQEGLELWVSNGTNASTQELLNIADVDLSFESFFNGFLDTPNGYLFVVVDKPDQLWRTNGMASNTEFLLKLEEVNLIQSVTAGGFFTSNDTQLWFSNGTAGGTNFLRTLPGGSVNQFATEGQRLYFTVNDKLWHSDATSAGTYQLFYITPDEPSEPTDPASSMIQTLMLLLEDCESELSNECV